MLADEESNCLSTMEINDFSEATDIHHINDLALHLLVS
jgi:hypothetical protein